MKFLFTGFGRFPGVRFNPAESLIRRWQQDSDVFPGIDCRFQVLPTEYAACDRLIPQLLGEPPDFLLMLGVRMSSPRIGLERTARNRASGDTTDAAGEVHGDKIIRASAEEALRTGIDVGRLCAALQADDHLVEISDDAGSYLCNYAYFLALDQVRLRSLRTQVVFVHLPMPPMAVDWRDFEPAGIEELESAIIRIVGLLTDNG